MSRKVMKVTNVTKGCADWNVRFNFSAARPGTLAHPGWKNILSFQFSLSSRSSIPMTFLFLDCVLSVSM